jgi:hypothetical protein
MFPKQARRSKLSGRQTIQRLRKEGFLPEDDISLYHDRIENIYHQFFIKNPDILSYIYYQNKIAYIFIDMPMTKRIEREIKNLQEKENFSEVELLKDEIICKYKNFNIRVSIPNFPFNDPIIFINDVQINYLFIKSYKWSPASNIYTLLSEIITRIEQNLAEQENFSEIELRKDEITCKYENLNIRVSISNFLFSEPIIFINNIQINLKSYEWSPVINIYNLLLEIITRIKQNLAKQVIIFPKTSGFVKNGSVRHFNRENLHIRGYLYNCNNFANKKYQFGSGFIFSIINQFSLEFGIIFSEEMINKFIDRLLDCQLIKELGCVYLVLKIYEEILIISIQQYIDLINNILISNDVKKEFNRRIEEFKRNNAIIFSQLSDRTDHLNYILTIYINIWLYSIFNNEEISFDLNGILETFMQTEQNSTELYELSQSFIQKGGKSIVLYNKELFIENYGYVMSILRQKSPELIKYIIDFLTIIREFNNFSNDMLKNDSKKIKIENPKYRLLQFKNKNNSNLFPALLVKLETMEETICSEFTSVLKKKVCELTPGSFCDNY